jgi:hypothetical protein
MRYIYSIIFTLILVGAPAVLLAQTEAVATSTASSSESSGGIFSGVLDTVNELRENVQEKVLPQDQSVLTERTQKRIINLSANISNRLDGISDRLWQISGRLEDRIEKQSSEGYDVTTARDSLAAAKSALETARKDLSTIDRRVLAAVGSTDPKTGWKDVRATYIIARDNIKVAHSELRNTIGNLKSATQPPPPDTATTTESTEVTTE